MLDIVEWAESRYGFYVDRHYNADTRRWVLKPGPIRLAPYHTRILRHVFTPDRSGRLPYDTVAWCEPAKSGKSAICGLVAQYVALHGERNSTIVCASNKQNQAASLMYKSLTDSIELSGVLPNVEAGKLECAFSNGNVVKAIASNSRTEAGARFSLALFDELWAYVYEDSQRLWTEFKTDPTRQMSLKFAVGYGGYSGESELWENLLNTGLAGQPVDELADITNQDGSPACWANGRTFVFWSHVPRQPWQTAEWIREQERTLLPAEFRRMILTEFVPFTETAFVVPEWYDACYDPLVVALRPGDTTPVVVALDLASGTTGGDTVSLVAVARWGDSDFAVKFSRVWEPEAGQRFDYDATAGRMLRYLISSYTVVQVAYDPYQAINFIKQFQGNTWTKEFNQTNERTLSDKHLYDLIAGRKLHHDGAEVLRKHVLNAGAKNTGDGKIRLVKAHPRKKIDAAVALSMACYRCAGLNLPPDPASLVHRPAVVTGARPDAIPEVLPAIPEPEVITVRYAGPMADGSFSINTITGPETVRKGQTYQLTGKVFRNLQDQPDGWWQKV